SAIAGVDQALWDIKGQRYNLPIYQFLGGAARDKVRVYSWIGGKTAEEITRDAKAKLALGYNAIKMGATDQPMHYVDSAARVDEAYDVAVAPHCPLDPISFMACLQLDSATPNVIIQEQVVEVHDVQKSTPLKYISNPTVFQFAEGFVAVPQGAGLGLQVNE